jgi:hypothetical protein
MQIKSILRMHLTSVRMATIKNTNKNKDAALGEGTLIHCWWGCILLHPPWKTARRHLKN